MKSTLTASRFILTRRRAWLVLLTFAPVVLVADATLTRRGAAVGKVNAPPAAAFPQLFQPFATRFNPARAVAQAGASGLEPFA